MKSFAYVKNDRVYLRIANDNMPREVGRILVKKDVRQYVTQRNQHHLCIKFMAWGFDTTLIDLLLEKHIDVIIVTYHGVEDSITKYSIPLVTLALNGVVDCLKQGVETKQIFYPIEKWKKARL